MTEKEGYRNLIIWRKADEFAYQTYISTKLFSKEEIYGITSQLRRSALSVPTNIVEGYARQSKGDFKRYISIALGSLSEAKYLLDFAYRMKYLKTKEYEYLAKLGYGVGQVLWKFFKSFDKK